jgi:regulator of sigma E protease
MEYSMIGSIFWFLVVLFIVVSLHELGHYAVARMNKVKVEAFSFGIGKELLGWTDSRGTRWKVCMLPIGGYVQMYGDADAASTPDTEALHKMTKAQKNQSFYYKKVWQKSAIVAAGPIANYLTAILIFFFTFSVYGKAVIIPEVSGVVKESAADIAGMKPGDLIVEVEGKPIDSFDELKLIVSLNLGDPIRLGVEREGKQIEVMVTPKITEMDDPTGGKIKVPILGIEASNFKHTHISLLEAAKESVVQTYILSASMIRGLGQVISGQRSIKELGGPVKIAQYSGKTAEQGMLPLLWFIALISINLGLVNLLPIPALDGGHLLYYGVEALAGKPMSEKVQEYSFRIGMMLLLTLMVVVTFNDVMGLVFG